ncbi:MAG: tyrosyl-tRNA synthetase [Patescibacteria group bacterium]|jgi:tyrosyl-tRNA synthetase|nr:tyrosyl-tRNA synthetase [Patescibacteria group bacterium]
MEMTREQKIDELLTRGVADMIDGERLRERLMRGDELRVKLGIDPTSPNLHIGRSVVLLKLRDFQELGCKVVLIVGDFTGQIGDTSDKESERPMLKSDLIKENMRTYTSQLGMLIDLSKAEMHSNSEWLQPLGFDDIGTEAEHFSVAEFIARENIKKRLDEGKRVSLREMLYPLMQGYDSVAVHADVELGGTDQRFNLLAGRRLQEAHGQVAQSILMTDLMLGTDGRKMSSSWGNTINLLDTPNNMFGKVMSIADSMIVPYLIHCTRVPLAEVEVIEAKLFDGELNPRDAKLRLAQEIVTLYHSTEEGEKAEKYFVETISEKKIPEDIPVTLVNAEQETVVDVLVRMQLATSKSDAWRKIEQGGVSIDGEKISEKDTHLDKTKHHNKALKVGKHGFVRLQFS